MLILKIHNDDTGDEATGNYDYRAYINSYLIASGRVEGHNRKAGAARLIALVAEDMQMKYLAEIAGVTDEGGT